MLWRTEGAVLPTFPCADTNSTTVVAAAAGLNPAEDIHFFDGGVLVFFRSWILEALLDTTWVDGL